MVATKCSNFRIYRKKKKVGKMTVITSLIGIVANKPNYFHKYISYNNFETNPTKISNGFIMDIPSKTYIDMYCGNKKTIDATNDEYIKIKKLTHGYKPYFIHDNGGRPFLVYVKSSSGNNVVYIYKKDPKYHFDTTDNIAEFQYTKLVKKYNPSKIFIGNSPRNKMTEFSGGHGKKFDGNTILLHLSDNKYVYIGDGIWSFKSLYPIVKYVSPVGNNDVPYPYAVDNKRNYYILLENGIVNNVSSNDNDVYQNLWDKMLITPDKSRHPPKQPFIKNFKNIKEFYIGGNEYTLRYVSTPKQNYDRISKWDDWNDGMSLLLTNNKKIKLTKASYAKLMNDYGKLIGIKPLHMKIIHKRF
jgi:hypothetical protein